MNIKRFTSVDSSSGRILIAGKTLLDILVMLVRHPSKDSVWLAHLILQVRPRYTMVKTNHLVNLYDVVKRANALNLPGDLVECGVWNGGSAALMAVASREDKTWFQQRRLWLFDSFQGLPQPGEQDGKKAADSFYTGWCKGYVEKVQEILAKFKIPLQQVNIVPGWFDATLSLSPVDTIAVLHIDADWYDSVMEVLHTFYDRIAPGGFVVLDDYGHWQGCRSAVHDFFAERRIDTASLKKVNGSGAYFQKPA